MGAVSLVRYYVTNKMSGFTFRALTNPLNKISDWLFSRIYTDTSNHKYIFVMSTGRCGTISLETIVQSVNSSVCFHEPTPQMSYMHLTKISSYDYYNFIFKCLKRFYIEKRLEDKKNYFETNHLFNKTFADLAIEEYKSNIRLIHLYRDPVSVAYSYYCRNTIPGDPGPGTFWCLDYRDETNRLNVKDVLSLKEFSHDYYKCLWYWYENEVRTKEIKIKFPDIITYTLETKDLNDFDIMSDMLQTFNLEYDKGILLSNVGTHINKNASSIKKDNYVSLSVEKQNEMNDRLLQVLEERYGPNFWKL